MPPYYQWPYARIGWTGSRQYNRGMRHYANKMGYMLSSHGMVHIKTGLIVADELTKEVFSRCFDAVSTLFQRCLHAV